MERIKNFLLVVLLGVVIFLWLFKGCNKDVTYKPVSLPELVKRDSFRTVIKYRDSVRVNVLKRYRQITILNDSMPCYTEVKFIKGACDTVIIADSILISSLKANIANDSIIIFKQGLMLKADSLHICKLNKKIKRNKFFTKVAFITGLGAGGFLGYKAKD